MAVWEETALKECRFLFGIVGLIEMCRGSRAITVSTEQASTVICFHVTPGLNYQKGNS